MAAAQTSVVGLMRASEARNWFTPADDPAKGQWFTRDIAAIARAEGLTRVAPFIVDADAGADPTRCRRAAKRSSPFPTTISPMR